MMLMAGLMLLRPEDIMPFKECSNNGKSGVKWGDSGKCYTGKGAQKKAEKQAKAAYASGYKKKK